ncbi:MAG: hypothetical protein A3D31_14900 [Candidatus Fluviicola riflensis]|nr:MAG: hypothetical protein CHH17_19335 [Candidatus Fluviicola riflensis]OGS78252.1 MAG: hypothetical protein A3D31_14900 [Candidatus Fluviicola riflensis]OGS85318.1 MAG: hypothetical protein A2724_11835 [Fluviicola sp. RIFCSPHIGHO2_01_FULL_43_53]OGS87360.1 MAG: hypothetical protein A3E30_08255 [Fluviicola sp. RIFCSPHIGHO2_12_FULL_43_24]
MSDIIDSNNWNTTGRREKIPGAGGVLAMGILSIVFSMGFLGPIMGIITLATSGKKVYMYHEDPERYDESSFKQLKAGRICGIIGLSLTGFALIIVLMVVAANS